MKRTLLLLLGILGGICVGNAQGLGFSGVEDAYFGWRSSVYRDLGLEKTGKERFVELSNTGMDLRKFSDGSLGLWDDSIDLNQAYELWKLYEYGKVGSAVQEGSWDSFQVWTQGYLRRGIVPLLVVDFTYAQLTDSFWLRGGYRIKEDSSGFEKRGPWHASDVAEKYAFGVFPMVSVMRPEYQQLVLDPRFILTDSKLKAVQNFGVEMDGWERELPVGEPMKFHWKKGLNNLRFFMADVDDSIRLALFKNPQMFSNGGKFVRQIHFWWKASWAEQTLKVFKDLPLEFGEFPVAIKDLKSGETISSGANLVIHFGKDSATGLARNCVKRPIVFVEGIDFGYSDMPEGCRDGKCGNVGYVDLLKGKQWNSQTGEWETWLAIEHTPAVLKAYLDSGYDVVYVDFWKGSDWIEHNAQVLESVLKQLSQRLCGNEMHVVGASMGGLVAKFALNRLEESGELGCIRSYTSFDSPHRGANIPLGMQQMSNYLKGVSRESRDVVNRMLNARAAKELLVYHFGSDNACDESRTQFLSSKYATSLPVQPWKLAIANGSGLGVDGMQRLLDGSEMVSGSKLAEIGITEFSRTLLDSLIAGCDDAVLRLLLVGSKKLLESTKLQFYAYAFDARIGKKDKQLTAMAVYGGGVSRKMFEVSEKKTAFDHQPGGMHDGILGFKFNAIAMGGTVFADRTCFIPTWSALNLEETPFNWVKPMYLNLGSGWLSGSGSGFDDYYVAKENQEHVYFDSAKGGNAFWLLRKLLWLDRASAESKGGDLVWFGKERDRFIGGRTVGSGSTLSINHPQELGKLNTGQLKLLNSLKGRRFYVASCSGAVLEVQSKGLVRVGSGFKGNQLTEIIVGNGSSMVLGSGGMVKLEGGNSVLRIQRGGVLHLKDKSVVEIWDGSSLIIEEGGKVVMGDAVDFRLLGTGSMFHVKGDLVMEDGAKFRVQPYRATEVGLVKFSAVGKGYGMFDFSGVDNVIEIVGNGKENGVVLQLEGGIDLRHGIKELSILESDVFLGKSTTVMLRGSIKIRESLLGSRSWSFRSANRWVIDSGSVSLRNNSVEGLSGGIVLGGRTVIEEMEDNRFMDNDTGLVLALDAFDLRSNRFEDNEIGVCVRGDGRGKKLVSQGYWLNNSRGLVFESSADLAGSALFLRENYFVSNGLGLLNKWGSLGMSCCNFAYNDTGISQKGGVLAMGWGSGLRYGSDTVALMNNTFDKNNAAHLLVDSVSVFWRGNNNFRMDRSYSALRPMVRGSVTNGVFLGASGLISMDMGKVHFWPKSSVGFSQVFSKHMQLMQAGKTVGGEGVLMDSLNTSCYLPLLVWNGDKSKDFNDLVSDSVFTLEKSGPVVVRIYDLQGRLLAKDAEFKKISASVSPGIYLVEWEFGHGKEIKKVLIDK